MRIIFITIFFVTNMANSNCQKLSGNDSLQITNMISDWNESWNSKDHILAAKWYAADAKFTNAFGDTRIGKAEIEALLKHVFALPFVMGGQSSTVDQQFQSPTEDVVLVHSSVERVGQKMPDGTLIPGRRTTHLRVFKKTKSHWMIHAHLISDARDKENKTH